MLVTQLRKKQLAIAAQQNTRHNRHDDIMHENDTSLAGHASSPQAHPQLCDLITPLLACACRNIQRRPQQEAISTRAA